MSLRRPQARGSAQVRPSPRKVSDYSSSDSDSSAYLNLDPLRDRRQSLYGLASQEAEMVEISPSRNRTRDTHSHHRRTSSTVDGSTTHRHRHRRRRRRSSEEEEPPVNHTVIEQHEEIRPRRRSSTHSLPSDRPRKSAAPHSSGDTVEVETSRRVRTRRRSASSLPQKESRYVWVEEVDPSDEEEKPTRPRRSSSVKETKSRPALGRSSTSGRRSTKVSPLPTVKEEAKSETRRTAQRSQSVWGNLFGPPRPEEKVTCLTCMDDVDASKAPLLTCGHRMCNACLKQIFTLSVTDPAHMPPKCCTEDCIPLKHVTKIFDDRFKMKWNRKYQEYTTKNRIYCPAKGCGSWIPPKDISRDKDGRKYGTCHRCKTQVCAKCNGKRHNSKECPKDDATKEFAEMAKDNGWQRCYNCSATVELKEGCNHMTCRCTAQFCMICGSKWKTCECPWFNYAAVNADRLNHLNIPQVREELARGGNAFAQPRVYQEELEQRRQQEQQDEALARRMAGLDTGLGNANWGWDFFAQRMPDLNAGRASRWLDVDPRLRPNQAFASNTANPFNPMPPNPLFVSPPIPDRSIREHTPDTPRRSASRRTSRTDSTPIIRRSAMTRTRARPQVKREHTIEVESSATRSENRRSALLAGLNRGSGTGRVDAWRQHVSGEPLLSPL